MIKNWVAILAVLLGCVSLGASCIIAIVAPSPILILFVLLSVCGFGYWGYRLVTDIRAEVVELKTTLTDLAAKNSEQEHLLSQSQGKAAIAQSTQMLAHDVRKPFSLLKMALDQLSQEKDPIAMRDIVRRFVPAVEKALDSADRMIADVMEFGHDTDLHLEDIAPDALVESTVHSLFRVKKDTNISLIYDFKHSKKVKADSLKVLRVLQNIVENAVEAMEGSGSVWFHTEDTKIDETPFVKFEVGNDGEAIPLERLKKLFDPFYTKGKKGGTGLGLSIAQKILAAHGGDIWCESTQDEGTRFYFTLPSSNLEIEKLIQDLPKVSGEIYFRFEAARKSNLGASQPAHAEEQDLQKQIKRQVRATQKRLRILLVDDHPIYMTGLNAQLMRVDGLEDLEVSMASSGAEAVALAKAERPHLIICDVDMGPSSIDGYEIVRKIRAAGSEALICMHSNHKNPHDFETAKVVGADGFLPKPMGEESLLKLLLAALPDESGKPTGRSVSPINKTIAEIALVDDCPFTLETWEQKLKGIRTHTFPSPIDFWKAAESDARFVSRLACVITDFYFDGEEETGGDFARRLKDRERALPILLASDAQVENSAIDYTIGKLPINWQELNQILASIRSRTN